MYLDLWQGSEDHVLNPHHIYHCHQFTGLRLYRLISHVHAHDIQDVVQYLLYDLHRYCGHLISAPHVWQLPICLFMQLIDPLLPSVLCEWLACG